MIEYIPPACACVPMEADGYMLQSSDGNAYCPIMAGVTMVLLPSILVFLVGQMSMISCLTAGVLKD